MVMALLLLLTYLLSQSRTPVPAYNTHFHTALQDIPLYDVQLTRDVLLVRAGLLPHADSLAQTSHALLHALAILQPGNAEPSGEMATVLRQQVDLLTTVVERKLRLVEYFTADNALLQNSLLYVLHAGQVLPMQTAAGEQTTVGAEVGRLSHALLRLLHSPPSTVGTELMEILDRLPRVPSLQQELDLLATHGRRVVTLLPQVDTLLHQLLSVPTTRHLQALHAAVVQYSKRREARAQVFVCCCTSLLLPYWALCCCSSPDCRQRRGRYGPARSISVRLRKPPVRRLSRPIVPGLLCRGMLPRL
jgi:hypothetical protein